MDELKTRINGTWTLIYQSFAIIVVVGSILWYPINQRFNYIEQNIKKLEHKLDLLEAKFNAINQSLNDIKTELRLMTERKISENNRYKKQ